MGSVGCAHEIRREFSEEDVAFLQAVANVLATSIQRKRAEEALHESKALLESQKDAFQAAMRGSSLEESLEVLVRRVIEFTGGRARAAFYIASPDGKALHHIIGMPEHYAKAVDNFPVSAESMACGLAVHTGQPEIAVDVEQEPKWEPYRWLARHHNFRACWSFPVRTKDSVANGTLAMYFQEPCAPTPREMEMAAVIAHAATVIISRHQQSAERERAEQAMRKRGERLQLLSETLGQLISARDPETIVRELFPKVAAHLGVDTYFNFMVNESGDALRLHSCAGIPEETARGKSTDWSSARRSAARSRKRARAFTRPTFSIPATTKPNSSAASAFNATPAIRSWSANGCSAHFPSPVARAPPSMKTNCSSCASFPNTRPWRWIGCRVRSG